MMRELIGYADRFSVFPGEQIRFMVSTDQPNYEVAIVRLIHADNNPEGPGFKEEIITTSVSRQYPGRQQKAHSGSYIVVDRKPNLSTVRSLTIQAWIYPTRTDSGIPQGIVTCWSNSAGYGLFVGKGGDLELWIGSGGGLVERIGTDTPLRSAQWYFVAATFDADSRGVSLYQIPLTSWAIEPTAANVKFTIQERERVWAEGPVLIAAALDESVSKERPVGRWVYNGKIDSPRLFSRALDESEIEHLRHGESPENVAGKALVAAWDFSVGITTSKITDSSPNGLNGIAVNMPMRAATGRNWTGDEFNFKHAPEQYGAIYFHEDDLDDACWDVDFDLTIPDTLKSGVYAARLQSGDLEDHIPFFVRPPKGNATASVLVLFPTNTYLAYANERLEGVAHHGTGKNFQFDRLDDYLKEHPELAMSIYDHHTDGSGNLYSTRLRPIVNLRPKYRMWLTAAPRHFGADLYLIDWLEQKGITYDVATDEDLHFDGKDLLTRYKVMITGTHPEYWTTPMVTALESYLAGGGRVMYLGGNGFYWITAFDTDRPQVIEVRRGIGGTRAWNSAPGEWYHCATGELGGLWRHRGKAPNELVGIGFASQGWDPNPPGFVRQAGSFDPRAAFIFAGIDADELIGNFGLMLNGAAGDEIDRLDFALGSPPHTLLLATASGHPMAFQPVIEDLLQLSVQLCLHQHPLVRSDIVYFETPNDGAVFSAGAITWCGALSHNHYNNNVSRITENVLRRFMA